MVFVVLRCGLGRNCPQSLIKKYSLSVMQGFVTVAPTRPRCMKRYTVLHWTLKRKKSQRYRWQQCHILSWRSLKKVMSIPILFINFKKDISASVLWPTMAFPHSTGNWWGKFLKKTILDTSDCSFRLFPFTHEWSETQLHVISNLYPPWGRAGPLLSQSGLP
jgi:hypothetical protein